MIDFSVEWQDAPGVRDRVLARTWSRLTIKVDGQVVTRAIDVRARSVRDDVYGSVFPLCRWIVENWWFLQHEGYRFHRPCSSRELARRDDDRAWVRRHSLLAAREGGALPDLTLFRDGDAVVARWLPDGRDATHPFLRFANEGEARLAIEDVEHGLGSFVHRVLERVDELPAPEVDDLRRDWEAIRAAAPEDRELCGWSARLGTDPYDPEELTDEREALLKESVSTLEDALRGDLLDAATADGLPADVKWIDAARAAATSAGHRTRVARTLPSTPAPRQPTAHETGYECARLVRRRLPAPAGVAVDMHDVMWSLGWARSPLLTTPSRPGQPDRRVAGS